MKPEIGKNWELALSSFTKAEELLRDKKSQEAKGQAGLAVIFAACAMRDLSKEPDMLDLSAIGENALLEYFERLKKNYTPEEEIEWSRSVLKRLSDERPPDTFPPFRG